MRYIYVQLMFRGKRCDWPVATSEPSVSRFEPYHRLAVARYCAAGSVNPDSVQVLGAWV